MGGRGRAWKGVKGCNIAESESVTSQKQENIIHEKLFVSFSFYVYVNGRGGGKEEGK